MIPIFARLRIKFPRFSFDPGSSSISSIGMAKKAFGKGSTRGPPFMCLCIEELRLGLGLAAFNIVRPPSLFDQGGAASVVPFDLFSPP